MPVVHFFEYSRSCQVPISPCFKCGNYKKSEFFKNKSTLCFSVITLSTNYYLVLPVKHLSKCWANLFESKSLLHISHFT